MPTQALSQFEAGARVRKPSAKKVDAACGRIGTVYQEQDMDGIRYGVVWDGVRDKAARTLVFEYPGVTLFERAPEEKAAEPNLPTNTRD